MEYHQFNESVEQKKFGRARLGKKFGSHTEFLEFSELRNFANFKSSFFFIGSRSYPNQAKLGIEYQQYNDSVKQKVFVV